MKIDDTFLRNMNIDPSHYSKILDDNYTDLASLVPVKAKVHFFDGTRSVIAEETMENYVKYLVSHIEEGKELNQAVCKGLADRAFEKAESAKNKTNHAKREPAESSEPAVAAKPTKTPGKLAPEILKRFDKK